MSRNFLMFNSAKTEVIVLGPKKLVSLSKNIVNLDFIALASSITVRNLGVFFDQELVFNSHVKLISWKAFFHLKSRTSCLNKMQKNLFTDLLCPG